MDTVRFSTTANALLEACFAADDPVACLHAELERLRASGEWPELQLRQLQSVTLQTIKAFLSSRRKAQQNGPSPSHETDGHRSTG